MNGDDVGFFVGCLAVIFACWAFASNSDYTEQLRQVAEAFENCRPTPGNVTLMRYQDGRLTCRQIIDERWNQ